LSKNNAVSTEIPSIYLAPMAGVTDLPFRDLVLSYGVGQVVSEMIASENIKTEISGKSQKLSFSNSFRNSIVQLAGCNTYWMSEAAKYVESIGCERIDINMGCPAKKVINGQAGSALMRDLVKAQRLIEAVVKAVNIPVTLKMRLGWDENTKNASTLAQIAEHSGVRLLTVHARTRCQFFKGKAAWSEIKKIKKEVGIPVIVNGDIVCNSTARKALCDSDADGLMIGRGARGRPWILKQTLESLTTGKSAHFISSEKIVLVMLKHYDAILSFYGIENGIRLARKHLAAYLEHFNVSKLLKTEILTSQSYSSVNSMISDLSTVGLFQDYEN
jgi:tRNA-dihydrouridine synthase B